LSLCPTDNNLNNQQRQIKTKRFQSKHKLNVASVLDTIMPQAYKVARKTQAIINSEKMMPKIMLMLVLMVMKNLARIFLFLINKPISDTFPSCGPV